MNKINEIIAKNSVVENRNCTLQFRVFDSEENIAVVMPAKKIKVNPNNDLLDLLKENGLEYKLN